MIFFLLKKRKSSKIGFAPIFSHCNSSYSRQKKSRVCRANAKAKKIKKQISNKDSFYRPGSASVHAGIPLPQEQTPPPPAPGATAADGTHPTGMHSCYFRVRFLSVLTDPKWTLGFVPSSLAVFDEQILTIRILCCTKRSLFANALYFCTIKFHAK